MNAALTAFHMADYVFTEYRASDPGKICGHSEIGAYRRDVLWRECPGFELLGLVANAHKHLWLGPNTASGQFTFSATQSVASGGTIFVEDAAGNAIDFGPVLDNVVAMWQRLIVRHQI